jgi:hypothetical protein
MNSFELIHVARDKRQVMHQCNGSDPRIIRPDDTRPIFKAVSDHPVNVSTWIIEGKRSYSSEQLRDIQSPARDIAGFLCSMHQFGTHDGTNCQLRMVDLREPINKEEILAFQNLDPDIRIQQVAHHQIFAGGNGSSSGSSGSSSAQAPIRCANSGIRLFISSKVGSSFSFSISEIAAGTRDSNTRAFSGARRSKVRSSSNAIAVTGRHCHCATKNSTSHFPTP